MAKNGENVRFLTLKLVYFFVLSQLNSVLTAPPGGAKFKLQNEFKFFKKKLIKSLVDFLMRNMVNVKNPIDNSRFGILASKIFSRFHVEFNCKVGSKFQEATVGKLNPSLRKKKSLMT